MENLIYRLFTWMLQNMYCYLNYYLKIVFILRIDDDFVFKEVQWVVI